MNVLLEARGLRVTTPGGRLIARDLELVLEREHVALVGRNGAGKSTLLEVLAGHEAPQRGEVRCHTDRALVPQHLDADASASAGEHRRRLLQAARARRPGLLLLDEPTQDLDVAGIDWLCEWLGEHQGGLVVVSHQRQLLERFHHFFVLAESGCRHFAGSLAELERDLDRRHHDEEARYLQKLAVLVEHERHDATVRRRRRRKKNLGRLHEERRAPSRAQLCGKKSYAQASQGKAARIRDARIGAVREWARAARQTLGVRLPLELAIPELPAAEGRDVVTLEDVTLHGGGRTLLSSFSLRLERDRLGVIGPNGAGKSTLLSVIRGDQPPAGGTVTARRARLGGIAQGATDWLLDDSLFTALEAVLDADAVVPVVAAHAFPLGLADRPLRSLSPGERVRAALLCLYQRAPELLVLDEPTASLDFVGSAALVASLERWPGGLVVASHDRAFLRAIGVTRCLELDGRGGHRLA